MENFCKIGKLEFRTIEKLSPALKNPKGFETSEEIIYDVCRAEKWEKKLRYDITVIRPKTINGEFSKTFGHYHSDNAAELFEVMEGTSFLLLQKDKEPGVIENIYAVELQQGEKGIVLPNHCFTNINPSKEKTLVVSNWINDDIKNTYDIIKNFHGLCYYVVENESGNIVFEKNSNYKETPEIIRLKPRELPRELENLEFLNNPKDYAKFLTIDSLYKKI